MVCERREVVRRHLMFNALIVLHEKFDIGYSRSKRERAVFLAFIAASSQTHDEKQCNVHHSQNPGSKFAWC